MTEHNQQKQRNPLRGEIWWVELPTDPPGKGPRPVVVVSADGRNQNQRANTVMVVPLTTTIHKDVPTQIYLSPGETGLQEASCARAENITVIRKDQLREPRVGLRRLSNSRICEMAEAVKAAMACR